MNYVRHFERTNQNYIRDRFGNLLKSETDGIIPHLIVYDIKMSSPLTGILWVQGISTGEWDSVRVCCYRIDGRALGFEPNDVWWIA
jgi:hypothetical protein